MNFKLLTNIPQNSYVAVSGGADSMAALQFLMNGRKDPKVVHFDHGTEHGKEAFEFVSSFCRENNLQFYSSTISREKDSKESKEEYWRNERHKYFSTFDAPVILGHHLDDVLAWYLMSTMHGQAKLIPAKRGNIFRPFLAATRKELHQVLIQNNTPYIDDPSNDNESYMRVYTENNLIPHALHINPGIHKVLRRKLLNANSY